MSRSARLWPHWLGSQAMQVPLVALVAVGVLNVAFAVIDGQPLSGLVRVCQLLLFLALFGVTVQARRQWVDPAGARARQRNRLSLDEDRQRDAVPLVVRLPDRSLRLCCFERR